jgi:hypothetical protein
MTEGDWIAMPGVPLITAGAPKLRRGKKVRPPAFLKTKLAPPKT